MPVTIEKEKPQQMDDTGKEYYGRGAAPRRAAPSVEKADDGGEAARAAQKDNVEGAARIGTRSGVVKTPEKGTTSGQIVTPGMRNFFRTLRKKQRLSDVKPRLR
tara:strand:- start:59 stop:370 length:312 start_codon:yes stop_codon:yes gene_type:complete